MTKRYRKFERLVSALNRHLENPRTSGNQLDLHACLWQLPKFEEKAATDPAKVRSLLNVAIRFRESNVLGRHVAEEKILEFMAAVAGEASENLDVAECVEVCRELHDFAKSCFSFKRARDAFGGRRRAGAFAILSKFGRAEDSPEIVGFAMQAIEQGGSSEARAAVDYLNSFFEETETEPDDD